MKRTKLNSTLKEIKTSLDKYNINFVLTRFCSPNKTDPDDLDILVKAADFNKSIKALTEAGFAATSHDAALGGRKKEYQKNLTKKDRIKIDLHKNFTWRSSEYLDVDKLIWANLRQKNFGGMSIHVPQKDVDAFLVMINVVFEKTYMTADELEVFWKNKNAVFDNNLFLSQAKKYGWGKTFSLVKSWARKQTVAQPPAFIPVFIVLYSYAEKLVFDKTIHWVSFMYFIFFRTRYFLNKVLPYD